MNRDEAKLVAERRLAELRSAPYAELCRCYSFEHGQTPTWEETVAPSGVRYQLKLYAYWDGDPPNLRVLVNADDGSTLGFMRPVSADFIVAPDGSFVGE